MNHIFTEDQLAEYKQTVESLKQQTEQAKVRCCGYVPSYNHMLHKKCHCSISFVCISSALSNDFVPVREFSFVGFFIICCESKRAVQIIFIRLHSKNVGEE